MRFFLLVFCATGFCAAQALPDGTWLDLTHPFNADTVYWPTADSFVKETVFAGKTAKGYHYEAYNFSAAEHGGTHVDAPIHFAENRMTVDEIPLDQLSGPGVVIDVSHKARKNRDYQVTQASKSAWVT